MMTDKDLIEWLREYAKGADFPLRNMLKMTASRLEQLSNEVMFTRKFIHEQSLEFELASEWNRSK